MEETGGVGLGDILRLTTLFERLDARSKKALRCSVELRNLVDDRLVRVDVGDASCALSPGMPLGFMTRLSMMQRFCVDSAKSDDAEAAADLVKVLDHVPVDRLRALRIGTATTHLGQAITSAVATSESLEVRA